MFIFRGLSESGEAGSPCGGADRFGGVRRGWHYPCEKRVIRRVANRSNGRKGPRVVCGE